MALPWVYLGVVFAPRKPESKAQSQTFRNCIVLKDFFDVGHLLSLLQDCFCVLVFGLPGMWTISSATGVKSTPPALEGKFLTTESPGKPHEL